MNAAENKSDLGNLVYGKNTHKYLLKIIDSRQKRRAHTPVGDEKKKVCSFDSSSGFHECNVFTKTRVSAQYTTKIPLSSASITRP